MTDCAQCPGTTFNCNETSACNNVPPLQGIRSCVASCSDCKASTLLLPDKCDNYCVNFTADTCNCGACNATCPPSGPVLVQAQCTADHCCPDLVGGGGTSWVTPCNLCCVGGVCPGTPQLQAQLCTSPLF